ncbi:MAG: regulatory protein IclR [Devosia sp.]|uniref:IclR family transcriptional regulator n=1 Tax=Devosia sp. TaxID=1871048 RepID=UPI002613D53B|nr:helix-turn-helix domain-containing protein [Devosia sp.]MDB5585722.1 regulatory protein IclR [Devosia sp.]
MSISTSLIRALDVLTLIAGRPEGASIAEVVAALEQPRSNVVRIINTLVQQGFVERAGRILRPTEALYDLCTHDRYGHLRRKYRDLLRHIASELNELVLLGVQEGNAIIHIDFIESDHRVRVAPSPVTRHDLRHNAIGKVALARRPDMIEELAPDEAFLDELAQVRRLRLGWNREETTEGVIVMACPGYSNAVTEPIIAVAWPKNRFNEQKGQQALQVIKNAIQTIKAPPEVMRMNAS